MAVKKAIKITPYDTPWEVACMLINAQYEATNLFGQSGLVPFFEKQDLRRIGEHLISYCNAEKEVSE